jgi:hypothetical protein
LIPIRNSRGKDWDLLWEGDEEIVQAEYARKQLGEPPVQFGMGFVRVHRDVYVRIMDLRNDAGEPLTREFYHRGKMIVDFHPSGAIGAGKWVGEDQGFYMWAANADATMRIEKRTQLIHWGPFPFQYPEQIPGVDLKKLPQDDGGAN